MNFCVAILILKMEEDLQHFWNIMFYYSQKGKIATEMQKEIFVQFMEKVLWLIRLVKTGSRGFMLDISQWMMLHSLVDQLKLIMLKWRH